MLWVDYNIQQFADGSLDIVGDEPMEVMKKGMFKPGDMFIVTKQGILRKVEDVEKFIKKGELAEWSKAAGC